MPRNPTARAAMNNDKSHLDWIDQQAPALKGELLALSDLNSGSFNAAGVDAVGARLSARFASLGGSAESFEVAPFRSTADDGSERERPMGRAVRIRARPDAPL